MDTRRRKRIGRYVREIRRQRGLSQGELATLVGYSSTMSISKIESGQMGFPFERANLFADALGIPREEFFSFCMEGSKEVLSPPTVKTLGRDGALPPDVAEKIAARQRSPRFWEKVRRLLEEDDYIARLEKKAAGE